MSASTSLCMARITSCEGLHETQCIDKFSYGLSDRGASIRLPVNFIRNGYKGSLEDRRPNSGSSRMSTSVVTHDGINVGAGGSQLFGHSSGEPLLGFAHCPSSISKALASRKSAHYGRWRRDHARRGT
jgi:hypothetical protein